MPLLAKLHEADVARDRDDPGDRVPHGLVKVRSAANLEVGVLHGVLGVVAIAEDRQGIGINQILGQLVKAHKGIPVALRNLREQVFINHYADI